MSSDEGDFTEQPPPEPRGRPDEQTEWDDDDRPRRRVRRELSWLDRQFASTSIVVLVLFPMCCGIVALVFAIVGVATCQDPKARRNAWIVLSIGLIWTVVVAAVQVASFVSKH